MSHRLQPPFETAVSQQVWESRYRYRLGAEIKEHSIEASWRRVAAALAENEPSARDQWQERFYRLLEGFRFLPGGRILAGAGTGLDVTLFNCFVMGRIEDSMEGIFEALKEGALTMQQGGGVGYDFSTLRPAGSPAWRVGGVASGPLSFMHIWDSMCGILLSTASRRGAMMACLRCDHPDIGAFVNAKRDPQALRNFNLSVLVSDEFMSAVEKGRDWLLVFPVTSLGKEAHGEREVVLRHWPGYQGKVACRVLRRLPARALWSDIMRANYDTAEPGVLFIDRINLLNNLGYREEITATNPCGEIPLPPYGACNLGSINLTRFVLDPFTAHARLDLLAIEEAAALAVRLLDNVIDISHFPLPIQKEQAHASRRIGLGITGLGDALAMLGINYGEKPARELAANAMRNLCQAAYRSSSELAKEKGSYPLFDRESCLKQPFIRNLPQDIRDKIKKWGLRNSHLTAIAPTGTISLLANNISSGIEPVFDLEYRRRIRSGGRSFEWHQLTDYALHLWRQHFGEDPLPASFVTARELMPQSHLLMQAALQPYVDNAISKTINVPSHCDFESFQAIYREAYRFGLKGCTTFRPNIVTGSILEESVRGAEDSVPTSHCCGLDRDDD
jgi:ribonucleoside-diphosphate reductase alpha chain